MKKNLFFAVLLVSAFGSVCANEVVDSVEATEQVVPVVIKKETTPAVEVTEEVTVVAEEAQAAS